MVATVIVLVVIRVALIAVVVAIVFRVEGHAWLLSINWEFQG